MMGEAVLSRRLGVVWRHRRFRDLWQTVRRSRGPRYHRTIHCCCCNSLPNCASKGCIRSLSLLALTCGVVVLVGYGDRELALLAGDSAGKPFKLRFDLLQSFEHASWRSEASACFHFIRGCRHEASLNRPAISSAVRRSDSRNALTPANRNSRMPQPVQRHTRDPRGSYSTSRSRKSSARGCEVASASG